MAGEAQLLDDRTQCEATGFRPDKSSFQEVQDEGLLLMIAKMFDRIDED